MTRGKGWAGLALIAVMAAASLAGCASGGTRITATFDDVGDLQTRGGVQVADVRVGSISKIRLRKDFRADVTMHLNAGVRVPKASAAVLRTTSLLGEKFIELRPSGDPAAGPFLVNGDVVHDTLEAPELEFVAQQAVDVLGAVTGEDVAKLVETGAEGFGGRKVELAKLISDLSTISATFASRTQDLTHIIDSLDKAAGTLASGSGEINTLLANLAGTAQILADNRQRAVTALEQLGRLAASQNPVLDKYRTDIDRQIKQLDAVAAVVAGQSGEVGNILDWVSRWVGALPKVIPGEFTQIYQWAIPADQDPRVGK